LNSAPALGTEVLISVRTAADYWVVGDQLQFRSITLNTDDIIEIITWNDTSEQGILTQVFDGTNNTFDTGKIVVNPERILVTLDGYWLFNGLGYIIEGSKVVIIDETYTGGVIAITSFTQSVVPNPMVFRIFQDMRGVQATYRMTPSTTTYIEQAVSITDDVIYVDNIMALTEPNVEANIWGVLTIDAERIMYRYWDQTAGTVSGLLRGSAGTAITEHVQGATVYNMGRDNLLPAEYQDYIVSNLDNNTDLYPILGNGTNKVFVAENLSVSDLDDSTTMEEAVEVYVGGIRVTTGYVITDPGPMCTIEFTKAPPPGIQVTILVRRGMTWYQQGVNTASNGVPLQETDTLAARFFRGL
jgi:hypothetical protein